jgi:hypothetical protein
MLLDSRQAAIAGRVLKVQARLGFLLDVGLHYLSLDRAAGRCPGERRNGSGSPRRSAPGWSVCSTCWTSRRSGYTSATTVG